MNLNLLPNMWGLFGDTHNTGHPGSSVHGSLCWLCETGPSVPFHKVSAMLHSCIELTWWHKIYSTGLHGSL